MVKSLKVKIILGIFFVFLLLISLFVRLYDLEMDTFTFEEYGTIWFDEGSWFHNARNKVLFNTENFEGDLWSPKYFSPLFHWLGYFSFSIFGVSMFSARLIPALLGISSVLIASVLIMLRRYREGLVFFILVSLSPMLIAYSRVGILDCMPLFFILIVLGLMVIGNKKSWFLIGLLAPVLLFSKLTSIFFVLAIPVTFILHYFLYKEENLLRKFKWFIIGGIFSSILWMFWLIPNFDSWYFINFVGNSSRINIGIMKALGALLKAFKFVLLNEVGVIVSVISIIYTFILFKRKEKVPFLDMLLIVMLILFTFQVLLADYALRRYVLLVPITLLISTRFVCKLGDINIHTKDSSIKIKKDVLIILFVFIYLIFSFAHLGAYFGRLKSFDMHVAVDVAREVNDYIPEGERVYGNYASALSLETKYRPYFLDPFKLENGVPIMNLFEEKKINYAILRNDLFDPDHEKRTLYEQVPDIYDHIEKNFEIIAELDSKSTKNNAPQKIYIYKRKNSAEPIVS